ncbi:hypothetical protein CEE45_02775 [Candidatus Heimdallarchaeota archaeon B3_Heim]|nr:MAG: hypothetical protein CEE45_02775 [Candidatus Heimdallarchaeota archaeon B3_Heim]
MDRGHPLRLETRAGEFASVARLSGETAESQRKRQAHNHLHGGEVRRMKMRGVTGVTPETD